MNPESLPPAIFLMGPTASGKTDLAIALADCLPCGIISVDSTQVYRGLDIGSAKPDAATLARAPHRLLDFVDPADPYSAAQFRQDALREMAAISSQGRIPLLVGGSMLYFKVLRDGLASLPPADPAIRQQLEADAATLGWPAMHRKLAEVDPVMAARLHPHHSQRILRALEVHAQTGQALSALQQAQVADPLPYRLVQLALAPPDRASLHQRIAERFDAMLAAGLVEEVRKLHARGDLHTGLPAIRSVGYRQAWDYLEGRVDLAGLRETGIQATRQLAKRQMTWLRSWPDLHWLDTGTPPSLEHARAQALKYLGAAGIYPR